MGSMLPHSCVGCGSLPIVYVALCAPDHLQLQHEDQFHGSATSLWQLESRLRLEHGDHFNYSYGTKHSSHNFPAILVSSLCSSHSLLAP